MLTPIDRSSLSEEVAKKLRAEILTGSIQPGERILEQEISAKMQTSRGPVRDALIRLEHEGLIVREHNRSATVVRMTSDDAEEVHSLRLSLELLALRYVMERVEEPDLKRLEQVIEDLRNCVKNGTSLQGAIDVDLLFHELLVETSKHNRVLSMWRSIKPQIWFLIFNRNAFEMKSLEMAVDTHIELVRCIRHRKHSEANRILHEHLDDAYTKVIETFRTAERDDG